MEIFEGVLWWKWLLTALSVGTLDAIWVVYTRSMAAGDPTRAAAYAGLIYLLGATVTVTYVEDSRYITGALVGALVGTYLTVKISSKHAPPVE